MIDLEGLHLNGYGIGISPYAISVEGFEPSPGAKRYGWATGDYMDGSILNGMPVRVENLEWEIPLRVYPRFTSAYTNLLTNPRPASVVTGWEAWGTSTVTFDTVDGDAVIKAVTTATASDGISYEFTGTVAAYSAGVWVKVASGTAPISVTLQSATPSLITATTAWQFVKIENATLAAAAQYLIIKQTDAVARTIYVKMAGVVQSATYPGYFDGACGDAKWNGTEHASTSTCLTGEDAISQAVGRLAQKFQKAESLSRVGGLPVYWKATGATYRSQLDLLTGETSTTYDQKHEAHNIADVKVTLVTAPWRKGPEYLAATLTKYAGQFALDGQITGCKGDLMGPARIVFTNTSNMDQRCLICGLQYWDNDSSVDLTIAATAFTVTGYSGTLSAAVNEVQLLTKTGTISGGSYTITLDGKTTGAIAYDATAATTQAALDALANVETADIVVTGGPIGTGNVTFTFSGTNYAGRNAGALSITSSLTGGGSAAFSTSTEGFPAYVSSALYGAWTTLCYVDFGILKGDYRMMAHVYDAAASTDLYAGKLRATIGAGDLSSTVTNDVTYAGAVGEIAIVDLGQVHIDTAAVGTQKSGAYIEAYTTGTAGNVMRIISVELVPIGVFSADARTPSGGAGVLSMLDNFSAISGAITGDTATTGQTWATMGGLTDADDFSKGTGNTVVRTAVSDTATDIRYGRGVILGAGTPTDVRVSVDVATSLLGAPAEQGVIAHFTNNDNFMAAVYTFDSATASSVIARLTVGASSFFLGQAVLPPGSINTNRNIALTIYASGNWSITLDSSAVLSGNDSRLASGALSSGKSGLIDWQRNGSAVTRTYSNFKVSIPTMPPVIMEDGQDLHIRQDGQVFRESATEQLYGVPPGVVVGRPMLGPAGPEGKANRLVAVNSRNNPDLAGDPFPDGLVCQVWHTPCYELSVHEA